MDRDARAEPRDWLRTVRQSIPSAVRIARSLGPTFEMESVAGIDPDFLGTHGITGLLWDVDGTLTHYHGDRLAPEAGTAARLFQDRRLRHAIVSNCDDVRLAELGRMFPDLPVLKVYAGDGRRVGRRVQHGMDRWFDLESPDHRETDRPARLPAPVRKPSEAVIDFAVRQIGLEPGAVVMIGDQYWTDIAGANLGGIRSIKVPTAGRSTFPAPLRAFQKAERWMRRILA